MQDILRSIEAGTEGREYRKERKRDGVRESERERERGSDPGMQNAKYSEIRVNISPHPPLHSSRLALSLFFPPYIHPSLPPSLLLLCLLPVCFEG